MKKVTFNRKLKELPSLGLLYPRTDTWTGYELTSSFHPGRTFAVARESRTAFVDDRPVTRMLNLWVLYERANGIVIKPKDVRADTRKECIEKSLAMLAPLSPFEIDLRIAEVAARRAKVFLSL